MMLRIQKERFAASRGARRRGVFRALRADRRRAWRAPAPTPIVMHPQPMNRGVEIASEVADGPQSVIRAQVSNGVAVRMAVLETVAGRLARMSAHRPASRAGRTAAPSRSSKRAVLTHTPLRGRAARAAAAGPALCGARHARAVSCICAAPRTCRCAGRCRSCAPTPQPAGSSCSTRWSAPARARSRAPQPAEPLSVLGPIGQGFVPHPERPRVLAIGGGVGIPPMVFLAERLPRAADGAWKPLVLMGSELPFPFRVRPSTILRARHARRGDRLHAAAGRMGRAVAPGEPGGLRRLLRRLRDRSGARLARARWQPAQLARGRAVRLRSDADARRRRAPGARIHLPCQVSAQPRGGAQVRRVGSGLVLGALLLIGIRSCGGPARKGKASR